MAAQCSFEFTSVVGGRGGNVIFNITERGLELIFFCFGGEVLSKFLLDNSSFSAPPPLPDNYCTVPKNDDFGAISACNGAKHRPDDCEKYSVTCRIDAGHTLM